MSLLVILLFTVILVSALYPKYMHPAFCLAVLWAVPLYALLYFIDWCQFNITSIGLYASAGIVIGSAWFFVSAFLLTDNPHEYIKQGLLGVRHAVLMPMPEMAYQIGLAGCKELIWRVFLIGALTQFLPVWLCIVIAAVLFWLVHEENWPLSDRSIEVFQFSLALSMLYAYTGSFALVWSVHMVRVILTMSASNLVPKQNT